MFENLAASTSLKRLDMVTYTPIATDIFSIIEEDE